MNGKHRERSPHHKQDRHRHRDDERRGYGERQDTKHRYDDSGDKSKRHRSREDRDRSHNDRERDRDHREKYRDRKRHQDHRDRGRSEQHVDYSHIKVKIEREENDQRRRDDKKRKPQNPFRSEEEQYQYGQQGSSQEMEESAVVPKDAPDFELSGKLAEDTNTYKGVVIKYNEPPEARKPKRRWRMYPFKGDEALPLLHIHRQSAYLFGRDRHIADIPVDHPSCSKQHAVLQYRLVEYERDDATIVRQVRPYVIDLESSNGTFVNNNKIEHSRYVELREKDVIKFGFSSREYVILHDKSQGDENDSGEDN
ncbi:smad nuclear-interacting protein 1-like [Saccoglossus kowalevskii]|uniref:Smad nuclear-interacting protein 1-like n=1 Tax=Saccoglossus kowalevskii TaxID=10224 RepID=A0A0U2SRD3_SACKO|nr:PREDICTED: smad nuclear-interacting protein 1-like [Saccoglossus kowalevskii]ALR88690.1 smad nuclear-interacting protein 1-like 212 [Saccoglossus kowalevskii]